MSNSEKKTTHPEAYTSLLKVYQEANPTKKKDIAIREAQNLWNELKGNKDLLEKKIELLKLESEEKKKERRLFFVKAARQSQERNTLKHMEGQAQASSTTIAEDTNEDITENTDDTTDHMSKSRETPAQTKLKKELIQLNRELSQLQDLEVRGMLTYADSDRKKEIQNEILVSSKALSKLESQQNIQQKYRDRKRQKLQQVEDQLKVAGIDMQLIRPVGRPRLEETQPGLLETILRLVSSDGQADERRRSEMIRSVKTLDQLQAALEQLNYKISRSATYLRLLPKRVNTKEGKRHVKTVPVKLLRSQNTARKRHEDTHFCASLVRNIKEMVSLLGPQSVLTISQDDKARIPLGLAAANKQAPILMKVEYRVELPDHDWVVAEKHKLIPSVYAILEMQSGKQKDDY
ncbi:41463_t:CDS:2 [Gigaspora margarita]|uniref:41463_t:CDS:1 n=1 Tax=Gigaspora margarita TaxID=4874 RepID=A0ABN7VIX2_GIGMA|nr:41463_t:CDS:2 [Gigaspora margarita]